MRRSEYEAILESRIGQLQAVEEDGSREGLEEVLKAEQQIAELEQHLWNSKAVSMGDQDREAAELEMTREERAIELASDLEPATTTDIDERLERYRRQYEAEAFGILVEELDEAYAKLGGKE